MEMETSKGEFEGSESTEIISQYFFYSINSGPSHQAFPSQGNNVFHPPHQPLVQLWG